MAAILNIHGYVTMEKCLEDIRKYVEVCAYKALCAAASPNNDPHDESWYPTFLDEEREIKKRLDEQKRKKEDQNEKNADQNDSSEKANANTNGTHSDEPIPWRRPSSKQNKNKRGETDAEGFFLNCKDLDLQAFMKVFKYRVRYREMLFQTFKFSRSDEKVFNKTIEGLIAYRNNEFAHKPVEEAEKALAGLTPEKEQELFDQYNTNIVLFLTFLRCFPKFNADPNATEEESYYFLAHSKWCEANKKLHMEEVELETVIQKEQLGITVQMLAGICTNCGIPVFILEGKHFLITNDYHKTVKPLGAMAQMLCQSDIDKIANAEIKKELEETRTEAQLSQTKIVNQLEIARAKESSNRKHFGMVIGLCVIFIGILVFLLLELLGNDNSGKTPENTPTGQVQQGQSGNNANDSYNDSNSSSGDNSDADSDLIPEYDGPAFISGTGTYAGLTFQVNQMKAAGILINYTNTDSCDYSLGWVGGAQVDVKTSVGTFTVSTGNSQQKILANSSGAFSVNMGQELMGKILSITVREVKALSSSGLPQGQSCTIEIPIQEGDPTSPNAGTSKFIQGQVVNDGLKLIVDQKLSRGIRVQYENDDTEAYSIGWVQQAKVIIKTSDGNVEGAVTERSYKIQKGTTGTFVIEAAGEITGTVEEIVIYNVNALTSSGLPNYSKKDQMITIPITQTEK